MKNNFPLLKTFTAAVLLTINTMSPNTGRGQTTSTVFSEDFAISTGTNFTTVSGQIGSSSVWYMNTAGSAYGAKIDGGQMTLANSSSATGAIYAYTTVPFNPQLNTNPGLITWTFNIRQIRNDPSGWAVGSYAAAFILASSSSNSLTTGNGYAITYGKSGVNDPIHLVSFTGGIRSGSTTNILSSNTTGLNDFGAEYISVKVTYAPATNTWEVFLRNDGISSFSDPASGTLTSQGTVINSSYTGSSLGYFGAAWNGSSSANQTAFFDNFKVTVIKTNQTITFNTLANKTYGDAPYTISATGGGSGNPVLFTSSDPFVATCTGLNGSTITIYNAGTCNIYANQAGNGNYNASPQVAQPLTVNKATQQIIFNTLPDKTYGDPDFTLTSTASSNLTVSYTSSNTAVAEIINGNTVKINSAGNTVITAKQAGNSNYFPANDVDQNLHINEATYSVTFNISDINGPVENANVSFNNVLQQTGTSGTTVFNGIYNGDYTYTVQTYGYYTQNGDLTISSGNMAKDISLIIATYNVSFNVTDGTNPIANAEVIFNSSSKFTGANGMAIFNDVNVGTKPYTVRYTNFGDITGTTNIVNQDVTENITIGTNVPATSITPSTCGLITTSLNAVVSTSVVSGAQLYEFEFSNTDLGFLQVVSNSNNPAYQAITLNMVTGLKYGRIYNVRSRVKVNNIWGRWSAFCQITLNVPVTSITPSTCGLITTSTSSIVSTSVIANSQLYEFEFTNTALGFSQVVSNSSDPSYQAIRLSMVPGIKYGRVYNVRSRVMVDDMWSNWSSACNITLNVPSTNITPSTCGISTSNISSIVSTAIYPIAQEYQFEFTNSTLAFQQIVSNTVNPAYQYIRLSMIPGITRGYTYNVRARIKADGVWGAWGSICTITFTSVKEVETQYYENITKVDFIAYPNPFSDNLTVLINGNPENEYYIITYDITGKVIFEDKGYSGQEIRIGSNWKTGIYFISVTGNDYSGTSKVIKTD